MNKAAVERKLRDWQEIVNKETDPDARKVLQKTVRKLEKALDEIVQEERKQ